MPLQISRNDINSIKVDAIVDPTDNFFSGSGGTDKLIQEAAGTKLQETISEIGYIDNGTALITMAYNHPNARYIIFTCGPIYLDGNHNEAKILSSCYRQSLELAKEHDLESIAFPLVSSGSFSFPKGEALKIATDTITSFLLINEMDVYLLVYDKESFDSANKLYTDIKDYLNENLEVEEAKEERSTNNSFKFSSISSFFKPKKENYYDEEQSFFASRFIPDESFSETLIRMIDEKGMHDPEVYKKANIDRKLFNHIKNTKNYRPKKETAVALAIGMELDINETDDLLERAGYVLSRSSKFDLIIRYCIENGIYDIYRINEILFEEDQKTLGC